jgi:hypothetical protein
MNETCRLLFWPNDSSAVGLLRTSQLFTRIRFTGGQPEYAWADSRMPAWADNRCAGRKSNSRGIHERAVLFTSSKVNDQLLRTALSVGQWQDRLAFNGFLVKQRRRSTWTTRNLDS